ncbi:MAG: type II toxin-antitoxin system RelE/ParE family toxin [Gammaproteobacteria bacterium]|nr:type II toxin-antitoxin system RelE/ParE family toxin [Gammaproteobacteria bacterium]
MRLAFTPEAVGDLRRLREFIAIHDPAAAQRVANHLLTAMDRLESFPELGVPVAMAPDPQVIRDLIAGDYVVRYLIGAREVLVLRVWHQREDR